MSSEPDLPSQSPAAHLPPEILDQILALNFAMSSSTEDKNGKALVLVCKSWCRATQRYLFESLKLDKVAKVQELADVDDVSFAQHVKTLAVQVNDTKGSRWTVEDLNSILEKFSNVTSLSLHLNSNSPGFDGSYSELKDLPNLKELELHSDKYDRELRSYRQILSATPNLTALHLGNDPSKALSLPKRKTNVTVDLPSLTRLSLRCGQLCRLFHKVKLLSDSTLNQIKELEVSGLSDNEMASRLTFETTSRDFLKTIGKNLSTLILGGGGDLPIYDIEALTECPNISTLIARRIFSLTHFPPSLTTIKYYPKRGLWGDCLFIIGKGFWIGFGGNITQEHGDWKNVRRFEIDGGEVTDEVRQSIFDKGVELVIDGEIWRPSSEQNLQE